MLKLVMVLSYPLRRIFGSGVGNIRFLKWAFSRIVNTIPAKYIVVKANGYKLGMTVGRNRGFDSMASGLMFGRGYEIGTTQTFKKVVKPNMRVVDIGAHIGYYTVLASKLVGDNGKVWAFEPEPRNYSELLKNIALNQLNNVVAAPYAIGNKIQKRELFYSTKWSGECSLVEIRQRPRDSIPVEVITLDHALDGEKIDVIKIDVDGGELMALEGAGEVINRNPDIKLFIECWKYGLEGAGCSCLNFMSALRSYGFKYIYTITEHSGIARLASNQDVGEYLKKADGINLLCSKKKWI